MSGRQSYGMNWRVSLCECKSVGVAMGHLTADQRPSELAVGAQDAGSGTKTAAHTDHLQLSETSTYHFLHLAACFTFPQLQCTFEDTLHC